MLTLVCIALEFQMLGLMRANTDIATGLVRRDSVNWLVYDSWNTNSCSVLSPSIPTSETASLLRYICTYQLIFVCVAIH